MQMQRRDLLPPYMQHPMWLELFDAVDKVFGLSVEQLHATLFTLRETYAGDRTFVEGGSNSQLATRIQGRNMLAESDYDTFDIETERKRLNYLGLPMTTVIGNTQATLARFGRNIGQFWYEKGRANQVDFLAYCLNRDVAAVHLWTSDYVAFSGAHDATLWDGGTAYPTNFVDLVFEAENEVVDVPTFIRFFYDLVNYTLLVRSVNITRSVSLPPVGVGIGLHRQTEQVLSNFEQLGFNYPGLMHGGYLSDGPHGQTAVQAADQNAGIPGLLMHFNGDLTDTYRSRTFTVTGGTADAAVTSTSKFGSGALATSATLSLTTTANVADFNFGSGAFTIEFFVRRGDTGSVTGALVHFSADGNIANAVWMVRHSMGEGSSIPVFQHSNGSSTFTADNASFYTAGAWDHIAIVSGEGASTLRTYHNGVLISTKPRYTMPDTPSGVLTILGSSNALIDELRIVPQELYTSNSFIVTTTQHPDPVAASSTAYQGFKLQFNGTIADARGHALYKIHEINPASPDDTPALDMTVKKYGSGSVSMNGNQSITFHNADVNYAAGFDESVIRAPGAITIQFWARVTSDGASGPTLLSLSNYGRHMNSCLSLYAYGWSGWRLYNGNNGDMYTDDRANRPMNTWQHFAITRDDQNVLRFFIDGHKVLERTNYTGTWLFNDIIFGNRNSYLGTYAGGLIGNLDDVCIDIGVCHYTSDFVPGPLSADAVAVPAPMRCLVYVDAANENWRGTLTNAYLYNGALRDVGTVPWVGQPNASGDDSWAPQPHGLIRYQYAAIDMLTEMSFVLTMTGNAQGTLVKEYSTSADGVNYSAWLGEPSGNTPVTARWIQLRWTVTGEHPVLYGATAALTTAAIVTEVGPVFIIDAADYTGGQIIANSVTAPADGEAQSAYNFTLGVTTDVETTQSRVGDPVFAGGVLNGGGYFGPANLTNRPWLLRLANENTAFLRNMHRNGSRLTVVAWLYLAGSPPLSYSPTPMFDSGCSDHSGNMPGRGLLYVELGNNYQVTSDHCVFLPWDGETPSGHRMIKCADAQIERNQVVMVALSLDLTGSTQSFLYKNGAYDPVGGQNTWSGVPSRNSEFSTENRITLNGSWLAERPDLFWRASTLSRLYQVRLYNRALSKAELDAQWQAGQTRFFPPAPPTMSVSSIVVNDSDTSATFVVELSKTWPETITVDYATQAGTARDTDFTAVSGTLTFAANQLTQTVVVPLTPSVYTEAEEAFTLLLSNATIAVLTASSATCTINAHTGIPMPVVPVTNGLVLELDAAKYTSGQTWHNTAASPADGTAQTALDFYLGASGSAGGDDPTFATTYWQFDGGDYFTAVNAAASNFIRQLHTGTQPFTIEAWWYLVGDAGNNNPIFDSGTSDQSGSQMSRGILFGDHGSGGGHPVNRLGLAMQRDSGGSTALSAYLAATPTLNAWHHHAVSYTGGLGSFLWLDGRVAPSNLGDTLWNGAPSSPGTANTSAPMRVGARGDGNFRVMNGSRIGVLRVYNRALSDAELLQNWSASRANYAPAADVQWNTSTAGPNSAAWTLSNGGVTATEATSSDARIRAAGGKMSGKWYFEVLVTSSGSTNAFVGLASTSIDTAYISATWADSANVMSTWTRSTTPVSNLVNSLGWTSGDTICYAVDLDSRKLWVRKNGDPWPISGDPSAGTGQSNQYLLPAGNVWTPFAAADNNGDSHAFTLRSRWSTVAFPVPDGFTPLGE